MCLVWNFYINKFYNCTLSKSKKRLNYNKADYDGINKFYSNINWSEFFGNKSVEEMYDLFLRSFQVACSYFIPFYHDNPRNNRKWMTDRVKRSINEKYRLWKIYSTSGWSSIRKYEYIKARNLCSKIVREAKVTYENSIISKVKSDLKIIYRHI